MGISLSDEEVWAFLERGHTGILTTLRRDGRPVALPVWYAVDDRRIYVGTPSTSKKVARIRHDDRASFLVESGEAWVELSAVHLPVRAAVVSDEGEIRAASRLFAEKYAAFQAPRTGVPKATKSHYSSRAILRLVPDGDAVSWDNARIRMGDS